LAIRLYEIYLICGVQAPILILIYRYKFYIMGPSLPTMSSGWRLNLRTDKD